MKNKEDEETRDYFKKLTDKLDITKILIELQQNLEYNDVLQYMEKIKPRK